MRLVENPMLLALLRWLMRDIPDDHLLIGYSYAQYRRLLSRATEKAGLESLHFTPHSPRSGFATELFAQGVPFERIKSLGRWVSDQSLRTYLDVVTAASIAVSLRTSKLTEAMCYCQSHLLEFFDGSAAFVSASSTAPRQSSHAYAM